MANFLLLAVCFFSGVALRRFDRISVDGPKALGAVIINVSLPALALVYLHNLEWNMAVVSAVLMPWCLFIVASFAFSALGKLMRWPNEIIGALILMCGIGNTSFVGIPVLEALYGRDAIPIGMAIDQAGSYLVLSTLGLCVAAYYGNGSATWQAVLKRVVTYPPFIAMVLAFLLIPVAYPKPLEAVLHRLADTVAPLALLAVGMQISLKGFGVSVKPLIAGLTFKLIACPALVLLAYLVMGFKFGMPGHVTFVEAAMGPSIGASIIATQHELNTKLISLLLGIGLPLSIFSAPLLDLLATVGAF